MSALKRMVAALLAIISVAVAVHFIVGEIYSVYWSDSHVVWDYLNWLMALAILVSLVFHFRRKLACDRRNRDENVTLGYLATNLLLFATMFLALWFFANWFEELNADRNTSSTVVGFVWIGFNASFIVLAAVTAWLLWNTGEEDLSGETEAPAGGSPLAVQTVQAVQAVSPTAGSSAMPSEMPRSPAAVGSVGSAPAGGLINPAGGLINKEDSAGSVQGR